MKAEQALLDFVVPVAFGFYPIAFAAAAGGYAFYKWLKKGKEGLEKTGKAACNAFVVSAAVGGAVVSVETVNQLLLNKDPVQLLDQYALVIGVLVFVYLIAAARTYYKDHEEEIKFYIYSLMSHRFGGYSWNTK